MKYGQSTVSLFGSLAYLLGHLNILDPYVEVTTNLGIIRGAKTVARNGRIYYEFLGIPYAKPPLGNLRFEPPQPFEKWNGVRDATYYGVTCIQYEVLTHLLTGGEDCLTLNVYTSHIKINDNDNKKIKRPVILFIHGGFFMSGLSYLYRGKYFMEEDVVLVTLNYRLNSFGFLNTGDGVIGGNMGLKDQVMALKWIKSNIEYFGGDPNSVTLAGQSAGAAAANYHMFSKMSSGLFHRVISMSGSVGMRWARSFNPRKQANSLARGVGCPTYNTTLMVNCLKSVNYYKIIRFHKEYLSPTPDIETVYAPTIEPSNSKNAFITEDPLEVMERGEIPNPVPWLTGVTDGEGIIGTGYLLKSPSHLREINDDWETVAERVFELKNNSNRQHISAAIRDYYLKNKPMGIYNFKEYTDLISDHMFYKGFHKGILTYLKNKTKPFPIYLYYFTYEGNFGLSNILIRMSGTIPIRFIDFVHGTIKKWFVANTFPSQIKKYGVCHSDDLVPLFNFPVVADEIFPGSEDYGFSKELISSWVYFAKHGKTRPFFGVHWPMLERMNDDGSLPLMELSLEPKIIKEPFKKRLEFWERVLE